MKLVEIDGFCFDAEDVLAFRKASDACNDWDNGKYFGAGTLEGQPGDDWTAVWFKSAYAEEPMTFVHQPYESFKVTMQVALRQTIGD